MLLPRFCSMEKKREHSDDKYLNKKHPNQEDEIADVFENQENQWEYMRNYNIGVFTRLAQYYYETDGVADYCIDTGKEAEVGNAAGLYTLMRYEGENILVHIGNEEFNTEVFTRKDIPKLFWFSHGPLKLFVVSSWVRDQVNQSEPKNFLNIYALIYSPRWGQAELRISRKQKKKAINYGDGANILNYQDMLLLLKNATIHKMFPLEKSNEKEKSFEKFLEKMQDLKKLSYEELQKRFHTKEWYGWEDIHNRVFIKKILSCLWHLSDGNIKNMYKLIASFDLHTKAFTQIWHRKNI